MKKCDHPSCEDGEKNGYESGVDCGGICDNKCENGEGCADENSNCKSNYCDITTGKCSEPDICYNGKIDPPGETDVDCGGPCGGCEGGKMCDIDNDCLTGLKCIEGICRADTDGDSVIDMGDNCPDEPNLDQLDTDGDGEGDACDDDIDGDGLKNKFEDKYNLDPYNSDSDGDGIDDGKEDEDGDELNNLKEQKSGRDYCLDPWNEDTDGDGASDKEELDEGTDPCDSSSKPGSLLWLFMLLLLLCYLLS